MKRQIPVWLVLIALITSTASSQEQAQDLQSRISKARQEAITQLQRQHRTLGEDVKKSGRAGLRKYGPQMKQISLKIKHLKNKKYAYNPELTKQFSPGEFGTLPKAYESPRIVKVIDSDEMIAEYQPPKKDIARQDRRAKDYLRYEILRPDIDTSSTVGSAVSIVEHMRQSQEESHPTGVKLYIRGIPTEGANLGSFQSEQPFRRALWNYYFEIKAIKEYNGVSMPVLEAFN